MNSTPLSRTRWICPRCGLMNRGVSRCRSCSYQLNEGSEELAEAQILPTEARRQKAAPSHPLGSPVDSPAGETTVEEQIDAVGKVGAVDAVGEESWQAENTRAASTGEFCELCQQTGLRALGTDAQLWQCDACDQLVWMGPESSITSSGFRKALKSRSSENLRLRKRRTEESGWGQLRELASSYGFILSMVVLVLVAGLVFAVLRSIQTEQIKAQRAQDNKPVVLTDELASKAPWATSRESRERVRKLATDYARATRAEEIVPMVIDGRQLEERIRQWLLLSQETTRLGAASFAGMNLDLAKGRVEQIEGDWWRLVVTGQTSENLPFEREVVMEITEDNLRIDWPASTGTGQLSWEELLLERPKVKGVAMRVYVEPARPPGNSVIPFIAQERNAYPLWIYPADKGKQPLVCYVSKDSILANALQRRGVQLSIFDEQGNTISSVISKRLTLMLSFPAQEASTLEKTPQVNIERVLRDDWLSYANFIQLPQQESGEEVEP